MEKNWLLKDTEQTKRMKEIALSEVYTNSGDIYKLLSYDILHKLVKKIKKGDIKLPSKLVYDRDIITAEEKFIENLDHYITYVRNNYFVSNPEMNIILEESLKNKYSKILFDKNDFHNEENYNKYHLAFKRMICYNFYANVNYFSKGYEDNYYILRLKNYLKNFDFENDKEINSIEEIIKKIINNRFDNVCNSVMNESEVKGRGKDFYKLQLEITIEDYYKTHNVKLSNLSRKHHSISINNGSTLMFNIKSDISSLGEEDEVYIDLGISNDNFYATKIISLRYKKEFIPLVDRLHNLVEFEEHDEIISFVDASLKFNFWGDRGSTEDLNIIFAYDGTLNSYNINLNTNDIKKLSKLIDRQIK